MELKQRIRSLVNHTCEAEKRLWRELQQRNLAAYQFRRQVNIAPYFIDFLCVDLKLGIQLHQNPGIETLQGQRHLREKTEFLQSQGYRILHFRHYEVINDLPAVVSCLIPTLARRGLELRRPCPYEVNGFAMGGC